ncbi:hypothetical protein NL676_028553 [Syzygium grande]|nr:hypothetical protein NL676_028553 [Syzygium grande]
MKIYSVSTRHYYAFGALVSEELSHKLEDLPRVRWVLPDSYHDDKNKDYGVPYDPKYHEGWERNTARANERKRRNDRPHNFDRSSNFERRRENMQSRDFQGRDMPPMHNQGLQNPPPQGNMPPPNMGGGMAPPSNFGGMPTHNQGGMPPNNYDGMPPRNQGGMPPNNFGGMPPKTTWVECCPKTTWVDCRQITWVRCHLRAIWEGCLTPIWVECHPQTWRLLRTWEVFHRIKDGPILRLKEILGICQTIRSQNYTPSRDPSTVLGKNAY